MLTTPAFGGGHVEAITALKYVLASFDIGVAKHSPARCTYGAWKFADFDPIDYRVF
jgi:hypothetical protein